MVRGVETAAVKVVQIVRVFVSNGVRFLLFFLSSSWLWCVVVVVVCVLERTSRSGTSGQAPPIVPTKFSPNVLLKTVV